MKKYIVLGMLAVMSFGCKSTSPTSTDRLDRKSAAMMKGSWTLTSVTNPGNDMFKVTSFELADSNCFEGSRWRLDPNNNKGEMTLSNSGAGCPAYTTPITWFLNKDGQFVLKLLNAGDKAKKVRDGYILGVANQTATSFDLIDMVEVAGQRQNVTYSFTKN